MPLKQSGSMLHAGLTSLSQYSDQSPSSWRGNRSKSSVSSLIRAKSNFFYSWLLLRCSDTQILVFGN